MQGSERPKVRLDMIAEHSIKVNLTGGKYEEAGIRQISGVVRTALRTEGLSFRENHHTLVAR